MYEIHSDPVGFDYEYLVHRIPERLIKDFQCSERAYRKLLEKGRKAKQRLRDSPVFQGKETVVVPVFSKEHLVPTLMEQFPHILRYIQEYFLSNGLDAPTELNILENRLPDGRKLSRVLGKMLKKVQYTNDTVTECVTCDTGCCYDNILRYMLSELREADPRQQLRTGQDFVRTFFEQVALLNGQKLYLTIDPRLILTGSMFASWSSCFSWNGAYSSSTMSFARDKHTAMLFLQKDGSKKKTGRRWVHFDVPRGEYIIIGKGYGSFPTSIAHEACEWIQKQLDIQLYRRNGNNGLPNNYGRRSGPTPYLDTPTYFYVADESKPVFSLKKPTWVLPMCLVCGELHKGSEIRCNKCYNTSVCDMCDERMGRDRLSIVRGNGGVDMNVCPECYHGMRTEECPTCHITYWLQSDSTTWHTRIGPGGHSAEVCHACNEAFETCDVCGFDSIGMNVYQFVHEDTGEDVQVCRTCINTLRDRRRGIRPRMDEETRIFCDYLAARDTYPDCPNFEDFLETHLGLSVLQQQGLAFRYEFENRPPRPDESVLYVELS